MLLAAGRNVAPGFRFCPQPAQTILESGSDTGNYLGVAVYLDGEELVLVSEMQAGWYRYCSMWRLHADGTIRPRFGFDAVESACVCNVHHHHVYWRLDFDIHGPADNVVREFNDPPIVGSSNWHAKEFEIKRNRDPGHKRLWRVENTRTGQGYTIVPGDKDGLVDAYGKGDLWVLRYHPDEIDDHPTTLGDDSAEIDRFLNGEPVDGQDLVVWYAAHFTHDVRAQHVSHIVGPDLLPHSWVPSRP
jgi:Cu2+-containing amine oxidase